MDISKEDQELLVKLQTYQQQIQALTLQKRYIQIRIAEIENALKELNLVKGEVYKSVGPILVKGKVAQVRKELEEDKDTLLVRVKSLDKQEEKIAEVMTELQGKLSKYLK